MDITQNSPAPAQEKQPRLKTISSEDLLEMRFKRVDFIVDTLLKPGLAVLAGAPKIGKSWMVLHLCMQVAKGREFFGMPTEQSCVLYIALEDSPARLQDRLNGMEESGTPELRLATSCSPVGEDLLREISAYCGTYPRIKLIVIDTFQKIRSQGREMSYANDYSEVSYLKEIADELGICILLVHHTRKLPDSDYMNEISGTNGIAGSADTLMVLKKEKRCQNKAVLNCTGRDIEDRQIELQFSREKKLWEVLSDSAEQNPELLPDDMEQMVAFVKTLGDGFMGSNTELCERFNAYAGLEKSPRSLKQRLNRYRYQLEDRGVFHDSFREKDGSRCVMILYKANHDKTSDAYTGRIK